MNIRQPLLGILLCAFVHGAANAQRPGADYDIVVEGRVLDETTGDPIKGAVVIVRKDGHSENMVVVKGDGQYAFELERGGRYEITYSAAGMVAKRVEVNTHGAPANLDVPRLSMNVDINLFPPVSGLATALFEKPMGRAAYSSKVRNMRWDEEYGKAMRESIRVFMTKYDAQLEKQGTLAGR
ncbi:MAG: carboxypeptidase regulatory-like domain-containing protein [Flavobacteriales bacterium]|nr:MAG: carboxypeptidase regulatory-like domain-containing protein [Flavobacteriales bacterium]